METSPAVGVCRGVAKAVLKMWAWVLRKPFWLVALVFVLPAVVKTTQSTGLIWQLIVAIVGSWVSAYTVIVKTVVEMCCGVILATIQPFVELATTSGEGWLEWLTQTGTWLEVIALSQGGGWPAKVARRLGLSVDRYVHHKIQTYDPTYRFRCSRICYKTWNGEYRAEEDKYFCIRTHLNYVKSLTMTPVEQMWLAHFLAIGVFVGGLAVLLFVYLCKVWMKRRELAAIARVRAAVRDEKRYESHVPGSNPMPYKTIPSYIGNVLVKVNGKEYPVGVTFKYQTFLLTAQHVNLTAQAAGGQVGVRFKSSDEFHPVDFFPRGDDLAIGVAPVMEGVKSCKFGSLETGRAMACATNGTMFTMGCVKSAAEVGFGLVQYDGTTSNGWSGTPYHANNVVYGMHTTGGKANMGLDATYIKTLLKKKGENRLITVEDLREEEEQDEKIFESSADWLFEQLTKSKGKLKMHRGLDEVRIYVDGTYHTFDVEEFDEVYYQWEEDWEDEQAARWEEEQEERQGKRKYRGRDYDDDFWDAGYYDDEGPESQVPHSNDPEPKNWTKPAKAGSPVIVAGGSSASVSKTDTPICKSTHVSRSTFRTPASTRSRGLTPARPNPLSKRIRGILKKKPQAQTSESSKKQLDKLERLSLAVDSTLVDPSTARILIDSISPLGGSTEPAHRETAI